MNGADCYDRRLARLDFAADDSLKLEHDLRGQDDWVFRFIRIRSVPAGPMNKHINGIDVRHGVTRRIAKSAGRNLGVIVQGQTEIRAREASEEAVGEHGASASGALLPRLSDDDQRAPPS